LEQGVNICTQRSPGGVWLKNRGKEDALMNMMEIANGTKGKHQESRPTMKKKKKGRELQQVRKVKKRDVGGKRCREGKDDISSLMHIDEISSFPSAGSLILSFTRKSKYAWISVG